MVTCKPLDVHGQRPAKWAAVTSQGLGARGVEATEPNFKRRPLSVVPDARRVGVNIKKLPLISHKAAANGLDLCKVPGAQTWGPHQWATTMAIGSADYETFAWWLVRENIGQGL